MTAESRSRAAIDPDASTTNTTRFASRPSRRAPRRSVASNNTRPLVRPRARCCAAAANRVAIRCRPCPDSSVVARTPARCAVCARERRPGCALADTGHLEPAYPPGRRGRRRGRAGRGRSAAARAVVVGIRSRRVGTAVVGVAGRGSGESPTPPAAARRPSPRRAARGPGPARRTGHAAVGAATPTPPPPARPRRRPPSPHATPRARPPSARPPGRRASRRRRRPHRAPRSGVTRSRPVRRRPKRRERPGSAAPPPRPRPPTGREAVRITLVGQPPPHHLHAHLDLARGGHVDGEPEPVQQLRTQFPLLRVHRADQHEPGGMRVRHPVALDVHATHRGGVEQDVDEVVVQQVDLVDVEHAVVRGGEQTRLERRLALAQHLGEVEGADDPVLRGPDGQFHQPRTPRAGFVDDRGEQRGQGAHDSRFRGALLAPHQHPADPGMHGAQRQREPQAVLAYDGAEREPGVRTARIRRHQVTVWLSSRRAAWGRAGSRRAGTPRP